MRVPCPSPQTGSFSSIDQVINRLYSKPGSLIEEPLLVFPQSFSLLSIFFIYPVNQICNGFHPPIKTKPY